MRIRSPCPLPARRRRRPADRRGEHRRLEDPVAVRNEQARPKRALGRRLEVEPVPGARARRGQLEPAGRGAPSPAELREHDRDVVRLPVTRQLVLGEGHPGADRARLGSDPHVDAEQRVRCQVRPLRLAVIRRALPDVDLDEARLRAHGLRGTTPLVVTGQRRRSRCASRLELVVGRVAERLREVVCGRLGRQGEGLRNGLRKRGHVESPRGRHRPHQPLRGARDAGRRQLARFRHQQPPPVRHRGGRQRDVEWCVVGQREQEPREPRVLRPRGHGGHHEAPRASPQAESAQDRIDRALGVAAQPTQDHDAADVDRARDRREHRQGRAEILGHQEEIGRLLPVDPDEPPQRRRPRLGAQGADERTGRGVVEHSDPQRPVPAVVRLQLRRDDGRRHPHVRLEQLVGEPAIRSHPGRVPLDRQAHRGVRRARSDRRGPGRGRRRGHTGAAVHRSRPG